MHEDERRGGKLEGAAHDFARIDRRVIDRADALNLIGDQTILFIEEKDAELFAIEKRHGGPAIIDHCGEARQGWALFDGGLRETPSRGFDDLQFADRGGAEAVLLAETLGARRYNLRE